MQYRMNSFSKALLVLKTEIKTPNCVMVQMNKEIPGNVKNLAKDIQHIKVKTEIIIIATILMMVNFSKLYSIHKFYIILH